MGRAQDLLLRAAMIKPALGNLAPVGGGGGKGKVAAGTTNISYVGDNQPLQIQWAAEQMSRDAYLGNVYVMRCARLIAETIAGLPWVSGPDPTDPSNYNKTSMLANLLGPATPQAPGGPNPKTSSRALWSWSIIQYLVTGRFGWECQLDGPAKAQEIIGLWPLVSAALAPIPTTHGEAEWFQAFQYNPPTGMIQLSKDQVVYCWRPRIDDWRQPESVLDAARFPVFIATAIQKYISTLLKNGMVASTLIVSPEFATTKARRAWQDQFLAEFTGVDKAGATIFGEVAFDEGDNPNAKPIQVEKLASNVVDSGLNLFGGNAQNDICIAFGVPRSLIGDASQRTYANAACPRASELIRLASGERIQAKDLVGKTFDLLTSSPAGPVRVEASASWAEVEETFAVTTESGRRIEVNGRHPLFAGTHLTATEYRKRLGRRPGRPRAGTGDSAERRARRESPHVDVQGWTRISQLGIGDLVAVTTEFPADGLGGLTADEATVLGALIGDGCSMLTTTGLIGLTGHHKFVPNEVFMADRKVQVTFLQALYAADGCAHHTESKAFIDLTSVSAQLLRDVQELLARMGISASIIPQRATDSYRLCIQKADEVVRFLDTVGIPAKQAQCDATRRVAETVLPRSERRDDWRRMSLNPGLRWERIKSIESLGVDAHVCITVPEGHTYLSTFWEHNSEYKNFWVLTVLNLIAEIQDHVNMELAPRLGDEVGWFDLSRVAAVQPESIFAPPDIASVIETGVADADQIANVLNIPPASATTDSDTDTVEIGEESTTPSPAGARGNARVIEYIRSLPEDPMKDAITQNILWRLRHPRDPNTRFLNVDVLRVGYKERPVPREIIRLPETSVRSRISTTGKGIDQASRMLEQIEGIRKMSTADKTTDEVHQLLAKTYPESTLGWVDDADWSGPQKVDLSDIDMDRRPGGRDPAKVKGIAKGIVEGEPGAIAPVVLVKTPGSDKLAVADGYHRTLAHKRVGHSGVPAYVGEVDQDEGPWDREMHDKKLNRADQILIIKDDLEEIRAVGEAMLAELRYDTSPLGTGKNWVTHTDPVTGLGPFVRAIAHALERNGHSEAEAIQIALGTVKRWAAGGGHVTAKTRAKAADAVAHWESLKGAAHAS